MEYLIRKMVCGRFPYYLGKDMNWEGLVDNAILFYKRSHAMNRTRVVRRYFPNEEIKVIKGQPNSDVSD